MKRALRMASDWSNGDLGSKLPRLRLVGPFDSIKPGDASAKPRKASWCFKSAALVFIGVPMTSKE